MATRFPTPQALTAVPAAQGLLPAPAATQGLQFLTNKGKPAKKGTDTGGYVIPEEGAQYRLTDLRGKNTVVASGTGAEGLQAVFDASQNLSQTLGKKANWEAEQFNPDTGQWERIAFDPRGGLKGAIKKVGDVAGDVALGAGVGALGAATGGLGFGLAPAMIGGGLLGAGLNAAGVNVTDVALPAAANLALPGLGPVLASGLGSAASSALQGRSLEDTLLRAGITAGTAGLLDVTGASDAIGRAVSNAVSPAVSTTAETAATEALAPAIGDIVVTANPLASAISQFTPSVVGAALSNPVSNLTQPSMDPDVLEVTADRTPQLPNSGAIGAGAANAITPTSDQNSLLDEIMKYYTLGSFGLDALGGLLGGSGSGGTTTPYVSQLGAMPTFARGGFTPYTGDYETYGFGPEFNFFGGQATTTTGPTASLLNPALPVNNTVVA